MKKIYPKDWVHYHPYTNPNEVDRYYCDLVNKINKVIYESNIMAEDPNVDDGIYDDAAIFIGAWFEDVISQTGVWQAFTSECEKRYGSRLPFYELDDNYYYDEINIEDIRFILWHCFQNWNIGVKVYNPENKGLEILAQRIYEILDLEYETAPENERLQKFFDFSDLTEDDYIDYRDKVEWFCFDSYINMGYYEEYLEAMSNKIEEFEEEKMDKRTEDIMLYSHRMACILSGRTPLLAISSPEYLKRIQGLKQVSPDAPYMNICSLKESFYFVEKEAKDYFVFRSLSNDKTRYNVKKESLSLKEAQLVPGDTIVTSSLFKYGKYWYHNGAMMNYSIKNNPGMKAHIKELEYELSRINQKETYKAFLSATKGKQFIFFNSSEDMNRFIEKLMDYKNASNISIPDLDGDIIMLSATPERGLSIMRNFCDCVASPDNQYYNKEKAEKNAINFFTDIQTAPYELRCLLLDMGYLKDAGLNSVLGPEHGRELVRKNAQFFMDYFLKRCRERDFPKELSLD